MSLVKYSENNRVLKSSRQKLFYGISKRIIDLALASSGLTGIFPILLVIAVLVKLNSPGPIFYRGMRIGKHGVPFRIFKFRSMVKDAEFLGGPSTAMNDARLTFVGRFLRKYKLDELPQLINILIGNMSFVGPRPQVEEYTRVYSGEEKIILSVRPGLTDYASIRFFNLDYILGNENVDEKYFLEIEPVKNKLRIKYVKEASLWKDIKILLMTLLRMLKIRLEWNTKSLG